MAKNVSRKIILAAESRVEAKGKPNELMRIYVMTVLVCMGQKGKMFQRDKLQDSSIN